MEWKNQSSFTPYYETYYPNEYYVKIEDRIFYIPSLLSMQREIIESYKDLLRLNVSLLQGEKRNFNKLKKEYEEIKKRVLNRYESLYPDIREEVEQIYKYLFKNLGKYALRIEYRIKTSFSLIEKMFRKSISPMRAGKSYFVDDLIGMRFITNHGEEIDKLRKILIKYVQDNQNLSFYYETPLDQSVIMLRNEKDKEKKEIELKGCVIEDLFNNARLYVSSLFNISREEYKRIKRRIKEIGCVKEETSKEENHDFTRYSFISNSLLACALGTKYLYLRYDKNKKRIDFILPSTSFVLSVPIFKSIEKIWDNNVKGLKEKSLLKNGYFIRPHYAFDKIEIPYLFKPLGYVISQYVPYRDKGTYFDVPPTADSSFYSLKTCYVWYEKDFLIRSLPFMELQILHYRICCLFNNHEDYRHDAYKEREKEKVKRDIENFAMLCDYEKRNEQKKIKKVLYEIYSLYSS